MRDQPITLRSVGFYKLHVPDPVISRKIGMPTSRKLLYQMACNYFGSWDLAVSAAGLVPRKVSYNRFWSRDLVVVAIRHLWKSGHPLNVGNIWFNRTRKTSKLLRAVTGRNSTGAGLHDAARRYFGSWDSALTAAGVPVVMVKQKPYWTKPRVVSSIRALHGEGMPLNSSAIDKANGRKVAKIIPTLPRTRRKGKNLLGGAIRTFGAWDRALEEAGLDPRLIRKTKFRWNSRSVGKILRILYESGVPINAKSLSNDRSERTSYLIHEFGGRRATGSKIYYLGRQKMGSWDATLKSAGFFLSAIRKRSSTCMRNPELLAKILRTLSANEFKLNSSAVERESKRMRLFTEVGFDRDLSGKSLLGAAKKFFPSWEKALWEAGFDPSEICLRSRSRRSNLSLITHQIEDMKLPNGERRLVTYMGSVPKNPEQLLEESEDVGVLESAIEAFRGKNRKLLDALLDEILQIHHFRDRSQLIEILVERMNGATSAKEISVLLDALAERVKSSGHEPHSVSNLGRRWTSSSEY